MPMRTKSDKIWTGAIVGFAAAVALTLTIVGYTVLGNTSGRRYSQATPDDVLLSAVQMVKNGDVRRLPELIHADSDDMRKTLMHLGVLLQHLQDLGYAIRDRFPEDVQRYKQLAEANIKSGKPPAAVATLLEEFTSRNGPPSDAQQDRMQDLIANIFADPYGWIEHNENRLSAVTVTDDLASILIDGKPAFGVGLTLKLDNGKWYLALPTHLPPVNQVMPKAPEQWRMINSLIKILDNTTVELTADVKGGSLGDVKSIGQKAQQKVLFPGGIWVAAYAADMDARRRIDRNMRQYRDRQQAWAKTRGEKAAEKGAGVSEKLLACMTTLATLEIGPEVRARKARRWAELPDREFEQVVGEWMHKHRLAVNLQGTLVGESIDGTVSAWEAGRKR